MVPWWVSEKILIDRELMQYVEDIVNIEYKNNEKIIITDIKVQVLTQYKSTSTKEKSTINRIKVKIKISSSTKRKHW